MASVALLIAVLVSCAFRLLDLPQLESLTSVRHAFICKKKQYKHANCTESMLIYGHIKTPVLVHASSVKNTLVCIVHADLQAYAI